MVFGLITAISATSRIIRYHDRQQARRHAHTAALQRQQAMGIQTGVVHIPPPSPEEVERINHRARVSAGAATAFALLLITLFLNFEGCWDCVFVMTPYERQSFFFQEFGNDECPGAKDHPSQGCQWATYTDGYRRTAYHNSWDTSTWQHKISQVPLHEIICSSGTPLQVAKVLRLFSGACSLFAAVWLIVELAAFQWVFSNFARRFVGVIFLVISIVAYGGHSVLVYSAHKSKPHLTMTQSTCATDPAKRPSSSAELQPLHPQGLVGQILLLLGVMAVYLVMTLRARLRYTLNLQGSYAAVDDDDDEELGGTDESNSAPSATNMPAPEAEPAIAYPQQAPPPPAPYPQQVPSAYLVPRQHPYPTATIVDPNPGGMQSVAPPVVYATPQPQAAGQFIHTAVQLPNTGEQHSYPV